MSTEPTFYLLPPLNTIAVEDPREWIGRIVKSFSDPEANFTPEKPLPPDQQPVVKDDPGFSDVEEIIEFATSKSLRLSLVDMLRISHSRTVTNAPQFQSTKVRRLKLQHEDRYCERILAEEEVKAQLKLWHRVRHPVYLIVSLLVSDQVHYAEKANKNTSHDITAKPPSQLASIAAASPMPMPDLAQYSMSTSSKRKLGMGLTATGRRIFAVEYRVLIKRLLSTSGQVDMRPGGVRGDRSFGREEEAMGSPDTEEQQSEVISDPDPFSNFVEEGEEDYCFVIDK
ncbi:hypothetical protein MMC12_003581 [Toensbergia leucococca]|nr:hypothetical protein [Toensbergia leucococca]